MKKSVNGIGMVSYPTFKVVSIFKCHAVKIDGLMEA